MRYLSVCSGIEAATVAWHPLGWTPVAFSEIEPFPSAVLAHHYPQVPNLGDMTNHAAWPVQPGDIDLLVGGTPCQSFSVAGLRKGLSDPRGGLMLTYLEIARRLRPRWVVWENVPGVLSSDGGRDFGSFLGALGELGYGWAYRVLDAQWVRTQRHARAVPQRRRRVFVVGCIGNARAPAEVLFARESVQRDSAPRRAKGQAAPADASDGAGAGQWWDGSDCAATMGTPGSSVNASGPTVMQAHGFYSTGGTHGVNQQPEVSPAVKVGSGLGIPSPPAVAFSCKDHGADAGTVAPTMRAMPHDGSHANGGGQIAVAHALRGEGFDASEDGTGRWTPIIPVAPSLTASNDPSRSPQSAEVTQQVAAVHAATMTVRRLTPRECERLQAFPDDYTLIPWRKKPADQCPDGPRYKALGNSMAVNCMEWIGERIAAYEAKERKP
jgi:DNA (cytosine-5)-methyltransferase 1